jgi:hypothetical protein
MQSKAQAGSCIWTSAHQLFYSILSAWGPLQPEQRYNQGSGEKGTLARVQNPPCFPTGEYYADHVSKIRSITTKFYSFSMVLRS